MNRSHTQYFSCPVFLHGLSHFPFLHLHICLLYTLVFIRRPHNNEYPCHPSPWFGFVVCLTGVVGVLLSPVLPVFSCLLLIVYRLMPVYKNHMPLPCLRVWGNTLVLPLFWCLGMACIMPCNWPALPFSPSGINCSCQSQCHLFHLAGRLLSGRRYLPFSQ